MRRVGRQVLILAVLGAPAGAFSCADGEIDLLPAGSVMPDAAPMPSCGPAAPTMKPGPMTPPKMGPSPDCADDAGPCPMPPPVKPCGEAGPCPPAGCPDDPGDDSSLAEAGAVTP